MEPLYVYLIDGYTGPVITTEVRPGLLFDTTPDNRLVGIEVLDYERLTIAGKGAARGVFACDCCSGGDHKRPRSVDPGGQG